MCLFDRNTASRGRSLVPWIFLRTRWWRRFLARTFVSITSPPFRPSFGCTRRRNGYPCPCPGRACGSRGCPQRYYQRVGCRRRERRYTSAAALRTPSLRALHADIGPFYLDVDPLGNRDRLASNPAHLDLTTRMPALRRRRPVSSPDGRSPARWTWT